MNKFFLGIILSFSLSVFAKDLTAEQKLMEFNQLLGQIHNSYGPLEYKQKVIGIDLKKLETQYRTAIEASKNNSEYYELILRFVGEFRDTHFLARIPSKKRAALPLGTDLVQGKVLVAELDTKQLPEDKYPIKRGDQIVSIDGQPVMDMVKDFSVRRGQGYSRTSERMSAMYLTSRPASLFPLPLAKEAKLEIKSRETGKVTEFSIPWTLSGSDWETTVAATIPSPFFKELSIIDNLEKDLGPSLERTYMCSGTTRVKKPENAVMVTEAPFVSYYYPTEKGNVGYLRIPHYVPQIFGMDDATAFAIYEYAVRELEQHTVGLIIDQDHNCGGSVDYLNKLSTLFVLQPTKQIQFRLTANKEFLLLMDSWMEQLNPQTIEYKEAEKMVGVIKKSYDAGEFLTPPTTLTLSELVYPNPVRYTKPIVMLIDEMSASGGDAFPSMLQGNGRAVLLGTRTAGAGGHVTEMAPLSFSRIEINMTRSLFYRPDGVEVENNGAVPNIPYTITEDDFVNGYVGYREFYTKKLLELL
jgi:C-terminal processing protease CtpA/Prc